MNISKEGIALIKKFEGIELQAYQDSVGVWTIGYGHTKGVKEGDNIEFSDITDYRILLVFNKNILLFLI